MSSLSHGPITVTRKNAPVRVGRLVLAYNERVFGPAVDILGGAVKR